MTIVAVFLALALGLLAGTTVVDKGLVSRLESQTQQANATADSLREQRDELQRRVDRVDALAALALPSLVESRLQGGSFVLLTDPRAAGIDQVRRALEDAGGELAAELSLTERVQDPAASAELASILGLAESADHAVIEDALGEAMSVRFSGIDGGEDDLLVQLLDAGFLEAGRGSALDPVEGRLPGVGGFGQSLIVVQGDPDADPQRVLAKVFEDFVSGGGDAAATEPASAKDGLVALIRRSRIAGEAVTVDNVDESIGQIALVVGLERLLETGQGGDFGFKEGRDSLMPPLEK